MTTVDLDPHTHACLEALAAIHPNANFVLARIAELRALLTLPKGTVHIVSDVHGEFKKLRHIINNASGSLRPLVERTFGARLSADEKGTLLNLIYYPREAFAHLGIASKDEPTRRRFVLEFSRQAFELLRAVLSGYTLNELDARVEAPYRGLFREMLFERDLSRDPAYTNAMLEQFLAEGREVEWVRQLAHVIRNVLISELIVAGDLGDRGPRVDKVIEYLMRQPNVAITWGNHDAAWMGACLGQEACIATVLRNSIRYRRLSQLEEGYGIPMAPLEKLARTVYSDDPADRFAVIGEGLRDTLLMQRMQKAASIIQFKLEGQVIERNPAFAMENRSWMRSIDPKDKTVRIDDRALPLLDTRFPTVDWSDPLRLSQEETAAMSRLKESFLASPVMWRHIEFVRQRGAMFLLRDHNLVFHGCVPVDEAGDFLPRIIGGKEVRGRAMFDALDAVVRRAFREKAPGDLDELYYLWSGRLSPLFGKDKLTTFERHYIADNSTHKETKNPYFKLIHDRAFCEKVLREFGVESHVGVIINGHVPVKVEEGESPIKESGMAITIDGAFSEAYGDKGYTLVLEPKRTYVAQHHHFESVAKAISEGIDIVPTIQDVRTYEEPRMVGDTERGDAIRREVAALELLLAAYRANQIAERSA